jgi:hypothetical protein
MKNVDHDHPICVDAVKDEIVADETPPNAQALEAGRNGKSTWKVRQPLAGRTKFGD